MVGMLLTAGATVGRPVHAAPCALDAGPIRSVTEVVDAETLRLDDGGTLRLLGILAPRAPDAAADTTFWSPAQEAKIAAEAMLRGRSVELAFAGARQDRYGRLLAHVFVLEEGRRLWLQGALLEAGHARVHAVPEQTHCIDELLSYERLAVAAGRGLWANAAYDVRQASDTQGLMRYRHTLQVVEGRIAEVAEVRGRVFLNFGTDWRTDFTASFERRREAGWPQDVATLKGQAVRVRGFIERRNGPYIELADPGLLEILEPQPEQAQTGDSPRRREGRTRRNATAK